MERNEEGNDVGLKRLELSTVYSETHTQLAARAFIDKSADNGATSLLLAAENGHATCVQLLVWATERGEGWRKREYG